MKRLIRIIKINSKYKNNSSGFGWIGTSFIKDQRNEYLLGIGIIWLAEVSIYW